MIGVSSKPLCNTRAILLKDIVPSFYQYTVILKINTQHRKISSASHCMDLVKRRDYEHYLTSLLLPDKVRQMSFALRALSIEISSIKDNVTDMNIGKMRVQFWKDAINDFQMNKNTHGTLENCQIRQFCTNCRI